MKLTLQVTEVREVYKNHGGYTTPKPEVETHTIVSVYDIELSPQLLANLLRVTADEVEPR